MSSQVFSYTPSTNPMTVSLENVSMFELFHPAMIEQLVCKTGRILFPKPQFIISGMHSESEYKMSLRLEKVSVFKFKYENDQFVETKDRSKTPYKKEIYNHPDGVRNGNFWMKGPIEFYIRVSNFATTKHSILLAPQCKYQTVLVISKIFRDAQGMCHLHGHPQEFTFNCLQFVAVTSYQNRKVADIKSDLNVFSGRHGKKSFIEKLKALNVAESTTSSPVSTSRAGLSSVVPDKAPDDNSRLPSVPATDNQHAMPDRSGSTTKNVYSLPLPPPPNANESSFGSSGTLNSTSDWSSVGQTSQSFVPAPDYQHFKMPHNPIATANWYPLPPPPISATAPKDSSTMNSVTNNASYSSYTPFFNQPTSDPMTNPSQTWTPPGNSQNNSNMHGMRNLNSMPTTPMTSLTSTTPMTNPNQAPPGYYPSAHDGYMSYHQNYYPSSYQPAQPPHPQMQTHPSQNHQNDFSQNHPSQYPHFHQRF